MIATRAVRHSRRSTADIGSSFDDITYKKGAAVLETIAQWIGENAMRRGIEIYLRENAGKSATSARLFSALDRASGRDVTSMAARYLDLPGVPLVTVSRTCTDKGWAVELAQSQWRPLGSAIAERGAPWTIPVCMRPEGASRPVCFELDRQRASFEGGGGCPKWIFPSSGAYYRFAISEDETLRLAAAENELRPAERITLLRETWASVLAGHLPAAIMPKLLTSLADDASPKVAQSVRWMRESMTWFFPTQTPPVAEEKAAQEALDALYGPDRDHVDVEDRLRQSFQHPLSRRLTQAFVRAHWDDLVSRLSDRDSLTLLFGASNACTPEELEDRRRFYSEKAAKIPNSQVTLDAQLEWASFCTALRAANPDFVIPD